MTNGETKQSVLNAIASLLGVPARQVARGSTEPKEVFTDVIDRLRLNIRVDQRKPALARAIAEAAGLDWEADHDSTQTPSGGGDTVTLAGLQRVREAVQILTGAPPTPSQVHGVHGRPYVPEVPTTSATPAVFERDPEKYDRSSNAHKALQNRLAEALRSRGIEPLSWNPESGDPPFDLAWRRGATLYLCEVKSATEGNQNNQVRLGLGQLLEYAVRVIARGETKIVLVLAMERAVLPLQIQAGALARIHFLAGPTLDSDLSQLLEEA